MAACTARLDALRRASAAVFRAPFAAGPCGGRFLLEEPLASRMLAVWPLTLGESLGRKQTHFPLVADAALDRLALQAFEGASRELPVQTPFVFRRLMKLHGYRRGKKPRTAGPNGPKRPLQ